MAYVTLQEYIDYVQVAEGYIDDGDPDQGVIATIYQRRIDAASDYIDSILGIRYAVPVPATALIKEVCCQIAHYDGEKASDARWRVFELYELAVKKLKCIADGETVLLNTPASGGGVVPQLPGAGDASVGTPGVQKVGFFVAQRNKPSKREYDACGCGPEIPFVVQGDAEDEVVRASQINHGFAVGNVLYFDGTNYVKAINTGSETLGRFLVARIFDAHNFEIARSMQVVSGFTGLIPGRWYHTSATTPGLLEVVPTNQITLNGAFASNPIGQAMNALELRFMEITPFRVG